MKEYINQDYIKLLKENRYKLGFFISKIEENNTFVKDISGYLRNLYCKKGQLKPFLERVCKKYYISINVQISASLDKRIERGLIPEHIINDIKLNGVTINDGLIFSQKTSPLIWFKNLDEKYLEFINIFDSINNSEEIFLEGDNYSINEFIQIISDSYDVHIDDKISYKGYKFVNGNGLYIGCLGQADKAIVDLAKGTINLLDILIDFLDKGVKSNFIIENIGKQ